MSIEINTGSASGAKSINWEEILSSLGEVKKADSVDGRESFTVTISNGGETSTVTVNIPDDLEIPENVDSGTLQSLVDKLSASGTGIGLSDEQVAQVKEAIVNAYEKMASAANEVASKSKKGGAMFNLYALMALMIDVAQSQRDAQREIRTSQNLSIQKSYQDQADQQRTAANLGMWVGIGCGLFSAACSGIIMAGQGYTASQQADIVNQSGGTSAKMHASMLQNTDTPENAAAQLNSTTQKVGEDVANRVTQDFEAKLGGDGNNGNLKTALDDAIAKNNEAKADVTAKEQNLATEREVLTQKEETQRVAQENYNAKTDVVNQKQQTVEQKQQAYDNEANNIINGEEPEARDARINAAKTELDTAKAELETAKTEQTEARTQLDTATNAVTQQGQKVNTAQNDLNLANQKVTTTETALTQARSDYQKTVSEVASSYQDKYQNAVDRLANPTADADKAQLKTDVDTAKAEMEMAFAKEAELLSENGVMTPTEQTNLVSGARDKVDITTDRAYRRTDVKALDQRLTKLVGVGQINQSIGGVLQTMAQQLSSIKGSEATRQQGETAKEEEMLDQTKDLFNEAGDLIDQAVQLYQSVIQMENQSMRDAIQA